MLPTFLSIQPKQRHQDWKFHAHMSGLARTTNAKPESGPNQGSGYSKSSAKNPHQTCIAHPCLHANFFFLTEWRRPGKHAESPCPPCKRLLPARQAGPIRPGGAAPGGRRRPSGAEHCLLHWRSEFRNYQLANVPATEENYADTSAVMRSVFRWIRLVREAASETAWAARCGFRCVRSASA